MSLMFILKLKEKIYLILQCHGNILLENIVAIHMVILRQVSQLFLVLAGMATWFLHAEMQI